MTDAHAAMWAWSACSVHGNHLFSDEWRYDVYQKALDRLLRDLTAAPEKPDTFTCPRTRGLQEASRRRRGARPSRLSHTWLGTVEASGAWAL